jgi:hypothetical protein
LLAALDDSLLVLDDLLLVLLDHSLLAPLDHSLLVLDHWSWWVDWYLPLPRLLRPARSIESYLVVDQSFYMRHALNTLCPLAQSVRFYRSATSNLRPRKVDRRHMLQPLG